MTKTTYYWQRDRKARLDQLNVERKKKRRKITRTAHRYLTAILLVVAFGPTAWECARVYVPMIFTPNVEAYYRHTPKTASTPEPIDLIEVRGGATPEMLFTVHYYATINHVNEKLMLNIMWCESKNYPNARNTKAVVGVDIGPGQINSYYHEKEMKRQGLDIHDTEDNIRYMAQLLKKNGTSDYQASKHCWSKMPI